MASGPSRWTRVGAGQYQDQYGNVLKGQTKAPTVNKAPAAAPPPPAAAPPPAAPSPGSGQPPSGQSRNTAMARDPKPVENMARVDNRIAWLKKNRPNDPEIKQLEARIRATPANPGANQPANPASQQPAPQDNVQPPPPPINWNEPPAQPQPISSDYMNGLPQMPGQNDLMPDPSQMYRFEPPQSYNDYSQTPLEQQNWEQQFGTLNYEANQGLSNQMQYAQQQGAFTPGSFQEQMDKAYNNVMDQFNRTNKEQFAREQQDFQQMAVERGLDPSGEAYKSLQKQLYDRQDMARQNAMSTAQQAAQGVQAQAYGQAASTYQMPFQQMAAYSPFYGAQANMQAQQQGQQFQLGSQREQRAADIAQTRAGWQQQERMGGIDFGRQQAMFQQQAREEEAAAARAFERTKELTQMGYSQAQAQAQADFERQKNLLAIQQRYAQANARLTARLQPRGGGGSQQPSAFEQYMAQQNMAGYNQPEQPRQPSTGNAALGGFAGGLGMGISSQVAK